MKILSDEIVRNAEKFGKVKLGEATAKSAKKNENFDNLFIDYKDLLR
jgi:hypothetical protein